MKWPLLLGMATVLAAPLANAQSFSCEGEVWIEQAPSPPPDPLKLRILKYTALAVQHRLTGLASYYSASLAGTLTAKDRKSVVEGKRESRGRGRDRERTWHDGDARMIGDGTRT